MNWLNKISNKNLKLEVLEQINSKGFKPVSLALENAVSLAKSLGYNIEIEAIIKNKPRKALLNPNYNLISQIVGLFKMNKTNKIE